MATATASDTFAINSTTSSNTNSSDLLSTPVTKKNHQHHHRRSEYPDKTAAATAAVSSSKGGIGIGSGAGTPETVMAETPSPVASMSTPMSSPHASASASRSAHRAASAQAAANDTRPSASASASASVNVSGGEEGEEEESSLHSDVLAAFEYSGSTMGSSSTSAVVTSRNTSDNTTPAQAAAEASSQATNMASAASINTAATGGTNLAGLHILSGLSSTSPETIGPATVYTAGDGGDGDDGDDGDNSNASGTMDGSGGGAGAGGRLAEFLKRENLATREALLAEAQEGAAAAAQAVGDREEQVDQFEVVRKQVKEEEEEGAKKQKEDGAGIENKNISGASPTKTGVVDAAVEASRKMAEVTAALNSPAVKEEEPTLEKKRSGSMEFGSMAEGSASISVTGSFTTDSAGHIVTSSTTVNTDTEPSKSKSKKSKSKSKSKTSSTTGKYTSDYAISNPSIKMKESMSTAEKLRAAEAEAARSSEGFVKVVNATENDDDYVPVADFTNSAKKKKKKSVDTISYDSADYAPESAFGVGGRGDSVQRYRMMLRKKKRRRRKMIIRAAVVVVFLLGAIWWWRGGGGTSDEGDVSIGEPEQATTTSGMVEQEDEVAAVVDHDEAEIKVTTEKATVPDVSQPDDVAIIEADEPLAEEEETQEYEEDDEEEGDVVVVEEEKEPEEDFAVVEEEDVVDIESSDVEEDTHKAEEQQESIDDATSTKGIKLDANPKKEAPIVKGLKAAKSIIQNINSEDLFLLKKVDTKAIKDAINKVEPRAVPFSHLFSKDVRSTAKTNPVLSNIDSFLESMMQ